MSNRKDDTKISAVEIMALDDEQLDQYLKDNMRLVPLPSSRTFRCFANGTTALSMSKIQRT